MSPESMELEPTIATDDPYQAARPAGRARAGQTPLTEEEALEPVVVFDWKYTLW